VTEDPDDDYLVALAVAAQADVFVSGDHHLTELKMCRWYSNRDPARVLDELGSDD
jgi:predicted nucleic acid-binding protein